MKFSELITQIPDFHRFQTEHIVWLGFSLLYWVVWIWLGKSQVSRAGEQGIAYVFTILSIVTWAVMTYAHVFWDPRRATEPYSIQTVIPLHLCYFLNIFFLFMHLFRSQKIFDYWYPWVMAACFQALLTPDLTEGFPHYYNIRYFIVHATLVLHALYGIFVYGFRPDKWTPIRALVAGNIYFWTMHLINTSFNLNFMYTRERPPGTILDLLGDNWFPKACVMALFAFYLVCLPFYFKKKQV